MGIVINLMNISTEPSRKIDENTCCAGQNQNRTNVHAETIPHRIKEAILYAFVTLPKEIGREILIGIGLASILAVCEPIQHFIRDYLGGYLSYVFVLLFGLVTYVCSTASVPMADAFLHSGMSYGQALTYLIVGPITSYGTILVIKKDFGGRVLGIYLFIICFFSVIFGLIYDYFI